MRFRAILLFNICIVFLISCSKEKVLNLPLTFQEGYGPFESAMKGISPYSDNENDPWKKTQLQVFGIPENWIDVKIGDINTDIYQSVYQNYYQGNIKKDHYRRLQKSWNWEPDSLSLSKRPIKCKIAFAFGKDSVGELKMIVDVNNNRDFTDDSTFTPIEISLQTKIDKDSLVKKRAIKVHFERFVNNEIVEVNAPLLLVHMNQYNIFMGNFAQYATTEVNGTKIAIQSNDFTDLSYNNPGVLKVGKQVREEEKVVSKNEYIEIENEVYKNLGVNKNKNILVLEKVNLPKNQLYSAQVGYQAFNFSGNQFKKEIPISLDDLKGKYVLLDFWATWCGPCIQEIPTLKDLYKKTDKSKFEIISIVGDSPIESLEQLIEKHSISWPQIISDDINKIKEKYSIHGYPTTFLLNPEGQIIAKNLRGNELKDKVKNLLNK